MLPKNLRLHLFIWFWIILSFVLLAGFLILLASGYTLNLKAGTLEKTGLISISSDPKGAYLYLNDKFKEKTPSRLSYLGPGLYYLKIEKEGYYPWEKTVRVEADKFIKEEAILFLKEPKIEEVEIQDVERPQNNEKIDLNEEILNNLPKEAQDLSWDKNKKTLLYRANSEIWLYFSETENFNIIARFSKPIQKVVYYPDFKHVLFVSDNELRIIEVSGENDTKLLSLTGLEFWTSPSGKEIFYQDGDGFKRAMVR